MSKRDKHTDEPTAAEAAAPANGTETPEPPATPADELATLQREVAELRDKNLRLAAEAQNAQKRAQRELHESRRYAESEFARELLVIIDDLERTQEAARTAPDAQAVADGVRIVYEHLLKVLRQRGIEPLEALGRPFDPTYHEALTQQPSDQPAGTVIQEAARGYKMHERVLRPSRVIVSAGPPAESGPGATPLDSEVE